MGCFEAKSGPEWETFNEVAKALDKNGGIALGYTTDKAVWSRYLDGADGSATAPPAAVVWSSFSPETGELQRGRKARTSLAGPFSYSALYSFLLRESQPLVLRLPHDLGPDHSKRVNLAFRAGAPRLFIFATAAAQPSASDTAVQAATGLRADGVYVTLYSKVDLSDENDEGAHMLRELGLDSDAVAAGRAVAALSHPGNEGGQPRAVEGWSGGEALAKTVRGMIEGLPPYDPQPGGKSGGGRAPPRKPRRGAKAKKGSDSEL